MIIIYIRLFYVGKIWNKKYAKHNNIKSVTILF